MGLEEKDIAEALSREESRMAGIDEADPPTTVRVRRVTDRDAVDLATAIKVVSRLGRAGDPVLDELKRAADRADAHIEEVSRLRRRLTQGVAMGSHAEDVASWLIRHGWTPPAGTALIIDPIGEDRA